MMVVCLLLAMLWMCGECHEMRIVMYNVEVKVCMYGCIWELHGTCTSYHLSHHFLFDGLCVPLSTGCGVCVCVCV